MKNIKIRASIISTKEKTEYEVDATYDEIRKYIYYIEKDNLQTATIYNLQTDTLERDNKEIYLNLKFKKNKTTTGILELKDLGRTTNLEIYTNKIVKRKTKIEIAYTLNEEEYTYKIQEEYENKNKNHL